MVLQAESIAFFTRVNKTQLISSNARQTPLKCFTPALKIELEVENLEWLEICQVCAALPVCVWVGDYFLLAVHCTIRCAEVMPSTHRLSWIR